MTTIPDIIIELRARAGMSQSALDEAADLPNGTIGKAERGTIDIKATYLLRIIEATGHVLIIRHKEDQQ